MEFKKVLALFLYLLKIVRQVIPSLKIQKSIIQLRPYINSMFLKHREWEAFQNLKLEPNRLQINHQNMIHPHGKNFTILKKCLMERFLYIIRDNKVMFFSVCMEQVILL